MRGSATSPWAPRTSRPSRTSRAPSAYTAPAPKAAVLCSLRLLGAAIIGARALDRVQYDCVRRAETPSGVAGHRTPRRLTRPTSGERQRVSSAQARLAEVDASAAVAAPATL